MKLRCISNAEYEASLTVGRIYVAAPSKPNDAVAHGLVRLYDDTGEDYLFPTELFEVTE